MYAGAAKGREEMAVPAMTTNATTNATLGCPLASTVAIAAAAAAANDDNDNDDNDGIDLDLRRMIDVSANRLAHAEGSSVDGG